MYRWPRQGCARLCCALRSIGVLVGAKAMHAKMFLCRAVAMERCGCKEPSREIILDSGADPYANTDTLRCYLLPRRGEMSAITTEYRFLQCFSALQHGALWMEDARQRGYLSFAARSTCKYRHFVVLPFISPR